MHIRNSNSKRTQRGVSLMEVMVGAALGMVCVIVIFQVVSLWEARTRTTSTGSDTQLSGTLAVYSLERELKQAGLGIGTALNTVSGCTVAAYNDARSPKTFTFPMAPVVITPKTDGTPDSIQVLYSNSPYFVDTQPFDNSTTTSKTSRSSAGFQLGDLMIVASSTGTDCAMAEVTGYAPADSKIIQHTTTAYTNFYTNAANTAVNWNSPTGLSSAFTIGVLFSLGPNPSSDVWEIQNNTLVWTNVLAKAGVTNQISDGVINLKAQYGVDGYDGCAVDTMIVSSGCGSGGKGEWTTTTPTDWSKVRAIRFAILVRSQQYEADTPTTVVPQPSWVEAADAATLGFGQPSADWQHYRYRVYESIVPLRNMIWGTAP